MAAAPGKARSHTSVGCPERKSEEIARFPDPKIGRPKLQLGPFCIFNFWGLTVVGRRHGDFDPRALFAFYFGATVALRGGQTSKEFAAQ